MTTAHILKFKRKPVWLRESLQVVPCNTCSQPIRRWAWIDQCTGANLQGVARNAIPLLHACARCARARWIEGNP